VLDKISNPEEFKKAGMRMDKIFSAPPGSEEAEEFKHLVHLVRDYLSNLNGKQPDEQEESAKD
jgi:hypothetical protein